MSDDKLIRAIYTLAVSIMLSALILAGGSIVAMGRLPEAPETRRFEFVPVGEGLGFRIDHKNGNVVFYGRGKFVIPELH